jgi:hypothetical protein
MLFYSHKPSNLVQLLVHVLLTILVPLTPSNIETHQSPIQHVREKVMLAFDLSTPRLCSLTMHTSVNRI